MYGIGEQRRGAEVQGAVSRGGEKRRGLGLSVSLLRAFTLIEFQLM
jgi:hypothetical protein